MHPRNAFIRIFACIHSVCHKHIRHALLKRVDIRFLSGSHLHANFGNLRRTPIIGRTCLQLHFRCLLIGFHFIRAIPDRLRIRIALSAVIAGRNNRESQRINI